MKLWIQDEKAKMEVEDWKDWVMSRGRKLTYRDLFPKHIVDAQWETEIESPSLDDVKLDIKTMVIRMLRVDMLSIKEENSRKEH